MKKRLEKRKGKEVGREGEKEGKQGHGRSCCPLGLCSLPYPCILRC